MQTNENTCDLYTAVTCLTELRAKKYKTLLFFFSPLNIQYKNTISDTIIKGIFSNEEFLREKTMFDLKTVPDARETSARHVIHPWTAASSPCISSETRGRGWRSWGWEAKGEDDISSQDLDTRYLRCRSFILIRKNCSQRLNNNK